MSPMIYHIVSFISIYMGRIAHRRYPFRQLRVHYRENTAA
jgi:hypothetical protein